MSIRRGTARAMKWVAPALALVLTGLWAFSGQRVFMLRGPGEWWVAISGGRLWVTIQSPPIPDAALTPTGVWARATPLAWWFDGAWRTTDRWVAVPLWAIIAPCVGVGVLCRRAQRKRLRARARGLCPACGYDRSGLAVAAACPECGAGA